MSTVPGLGYLVRALPLLLIGSAVVWGVTALWLRPDRRGPARMIGGAVVYAIAAVTVKPFVGVVQLTATSDAGRTTVSAVSTGVAPVRVVPTAGHAAAPLDLGYGHTGALVLTDPPADGKFAFAAHIHLGWTGWLLFAGVSALPLLWVLMVGFRRFDADVSGESPEDVAS